MCKDHVADYISQDPRVDQEIIDSIDQAYFSDDHTVDIVEYDIKVPVVICVAFGFLVQIASTFYSNTIEFQTQFWTICVN